MRIRREERGAHWPEGGGQDPQERGTPGANARRSHATGAWEEGKGPECRSWRDGQTAPRAGDGGSPTVLGARGGVPGGRERGSLGADVREGSAWRGSSGLGALDPKKPTWGGSCAACREDPGRVIAGKSKWRVKLVRLPGGGEQAGECGQEHEAGQESRGGREAVGTE